MEDGLSFSEEALKWAIKLFKLLEIELEQNGDRVLWSIRQIGAEPDEFQITCSFEEEPMRILVHGQELKGRIGGKTLSGPELTRSMELYLGPLVSYLQQARAEWISARHEEDRSFGTTRSLGSKKFRVGAKVRAKGFRFTPSGSTRLATPVLSAEFWITDVKGEEVLVLSDVRLSGSIGRSCVRIRRMVVRD
ncbi:MAG: hypothetical protein DRO05_06960 [Thermoproteota archaeon]|nr:MAG: hypothetical protein DRO05_06960 [Candidatus Korarchaeota archaeon]